MTGVQMPQGPRLDVPKSSQGTPLPPYDPEAGGTFAKASR